MGVTTPPGIDVTTDAPALATITRNARKTETATFFILQIPPLRWNCRQPTLRQVSINYHRLSCIPITNFVLAKMMKTRCRREVRPSEVQTLASQWAIGYLGPATLGWLNQPRGFLGEVREHNRGARALDASQRFQHHALVVDPAVDRCRLDHGVLAAH